MAVPDDRSQRRKVLFTGMPWFLLALLLLGVTVAAWLPAHAPAPRGPRPAPVKETPRVLGGTGAPAEHSSGPTPDGEPPAEGEPEDPDDFGVFDFPRAGPFLAGSRWRGSLLLRDASTGMEIQAPVSSQFETTVRTGNATWGRTFQGPCVGGRVPIYTDHVPNYTGGPTTGDEPAAPAAAEEPGWVRVRVPGYAEKRVPHPENGAEAEVRLDPWTVAVHGVVEVPGADDAWIAMRLQAAEVDAEGTPRLAGPLEHPGPFEIFDMPPGVYELVVQARTASGVLWAKRRIEYRGALLDLGVIEVDGASGIRVRMVDPDGRPLLDSPIRAEIQAVKGRVLPLGSPMDHIAASSVTVRPSPGGDGWVELTGLLPGGRYEVQAQEAGRVEAEAVAPEESGTFAEVTLMRTLRAVRCTLRFTLRGEAPAYWEIVNSPFAEEGWTAPGVFAGDLLPGRYSVGLRVNAVKKDPGHATWVSIEVPEEAVFDRTYDL